MPPFRRATQKNSSLRPIDVQTSIAAVECADNHVYIFPTQDLSRDLCHHTNELERQCLKRIRFTTDGETYIAAAAEVTSDEPELTNEPGN